MEGWGMEWRPGGFAAGPRMMFNDDCLTLFGLCCLAVEWIPYQEPTFTRGSR